MASLSRSPNGSSGGILTLGRHVEVPSRNTIPLWVNNFRGTGSVMKKKPRTLHDLKEAIRQEIRPIDRQLLASVMDD